MRMFPGREIIIGKAYPSPIFRMLQFQRPLLLGVAKLQAILFRKDVQQRIDQAVLGFLILAERRSVPFAPGTDKADLAGGNQAIVLLQEGAQLFQMPHDAFFRFTTIGIQSFVIIGKTQDNLEAMRLYVVKNGLHMGKCFRRQVAIHIV